MAYSDNFSEQITDFVESLVAADKLEFSELIYRQNEEVSDLVSEHQIQTGVRNGHMIPIINNEANFESFPFTDQKSCDTPACDLTTEYSNKRWELGIIGCRVPICMKSFDEDFLLFWNMFRRTPSESDIETAFIQFLINQFQTNLLAAQWRVAYFGDKSSSSNLFNGIDGFFTQAEAVGANQRVPIVENAALTLAGQRLSGERVLELLNEMYDKATGELWFDLSTARFKMTRINALAFIGYLNKLGKNSPWNCECLDPNAVGNANVFTLQGLRFNGIPIEVHNEWDMVINKTAELNGGGGTNPRTNPNRILLTYRSNLRIGTPETDSLNSFDIFYDKKDRKIYMDGDSHIGSSLVLPNEQILAI